MSDDETGDRASFLFHGDALAGEQLRVLRFEGREELSQPFQFIVRLLSKNAGIDLDAPLGESACLTLMRPPAASRFVHGIIDRFELIHVGTRYAEYEARLVPSLSLLRYTRNSRVLRGSAFEIINQVLDHADFPSSAINTKGVGKVPGTRDYCVQHQESDWHFISRLLEEEGILYYFQHSADADTLVCSDDSPGLQSLSGGGTVPYLPESLAVAAKGEFIYELGARVAVRPGKLTMRDFRFKQPSRNLQIEKSSQDPKFRKLESYLFPGEYTDEDLGDHLGQRRLEEQQWDRHLRVGKTTCTRMVPGAVLGVASHLGRGDLNGDYVIVSVHHRVTELQALGEEAGPRADHTHIPYHNEVLLLPKSVVYRPPRRTARPEIQGLQSAVVVGPQEEEIYCDEYGRVRVQFHWDREGKHDSNSSCWVRVSQPWAGSGQGAIFIPRIGQEVLVQFLEGDPDRPVIIGRVYNGENPVPHPLPGAKNISTIRTASTPGGNGYNELKFDDSAGKEEVFFHAQRDHNEVIERNHSESVGANQSMSIGADQSLSVGGDRSHTVHKNESITIDENQDVTVTGSQSTTIETGQTIEVNNGQSVTVNSGQSTCITGGQTIDVEGGQQSNVAGGQNMTVTGGQTEDVTGGRTTSITGEDKLTVSSNLTIGVTGSTNLTSVGKISITSLPKVETSAIQIEEKGLIIKTEGLLRKTEGLFITTEGVFITIEGAFVTVKGSQVSIEGASTTNIKGGGMVNVTGGVIKLNC